VYGRVRHSSTQHSFACMHLSLSSPCVTPCMHHSMCLLVTYHPSDAWTSTRMVCLGCSVDAPHCSERPADTWGAHCSGAYTPRTLYVYATYTTTICIRHVHYMYTPRTLYVYATYTICKRHVHYMWRRSVVYVAYPARRIPYSICGAHKTDARHKPDTRASSAFQGRYLVLLT
jgi:hypothetical protein